MSAAIPKGSFYLPGVIAALLPVVRAKMLFRQLCVRTRDLALFTELRHGPISRSARPLA